MGDRGSLSAADAITLIRAAMGLLAAVMVLTVSPLSAIPMILISSVLDGIDGEVARRLGTEHRLGHVLDGVADLLCFCAAPAFAVYGLAAGQLDPDVSTDEPLAGAPLPSGIFDPLFLPLLVSAAILVIGAIRLSRFVMERGDDPAFTGIPTAALAIFGLCLLHPYVAAVVPALWSVALVGIITPLELSRIRYPKLRPAPGLAALILMLLMSAETAATVWGPGPLLGLPAVLPLLAAIGGYIFAGPQFARPRPGRRKRPGKNGRG